METIADYQFHSIEDSIGEGNFGFVYKAKRVSDPNQLVAIKSVGRSESKLVIREIGVLEKLTKVRHNNIVSLIEWLQVDDSVYLVMEYCNGRDMSFLLRRLRELDEKTIRVFLQQMSAALKILKENNIVHRDLKPQNVLLVYPPQLPLDPSKITYKIGDFGLSRFVPYGGKASTVCGSLAYMAPEIFETDNASNATAYDYKVDVWSLGVIAIESFTGRVPFNCNNVKKLKESHEACKNEPARIIPAAASEGFKDLLKELLSFDSETRIGCDKLLDHPFLKAKEDEN